VERFYNEYNKELRKYNDEMKINDLSGKTTFLQGQGKRGRQAARKLSEIRSAMKSPRLKLLEQVKEQMDFQRANAKVIYDDRKLTPQEKEQALDLLWWTVINLAREGIGKKPVPEGN